MIVSYHFSSCVLWVHQLINFSELPVIVLVVLYVFFFYPYWVTDLTELNIEFGVSFSWLHKFPSAVKAAFSIFVLLSLSFPHFLFYIAIVNM